MSHKFQFKPGDEVITKYGEIGTVLGADFVYIRVFFKSDLTKTNTDGWRLYFPDEIKLFKRKS